MLLDAGADKEIQDKVNDVYVFLYNRSDTKFCLQNGLTAYDIASSKSHAAVCQLLEQYKYRSEVQFYSQLTLLWCH